jgi:hypothetical protein
MRRRLQPWWRTTQLRIAARGDRALEDIFGRRLNWSYVDEPRRGDHVCYISDCSRLSADYPSWAVTIDLDDIFAQLGELRAPRAVLSDAVVIPT